MGNIWKRSLSMFLAVILVVGMLPVNAFAAEGEVTEVTEAVETTAPETTEAPAETQAPAETEAPAQTEAPATEAPTETEAPKETEVPVETTVPAETEGAVIVSGDSSNSKAKAEAVLATGSSWNSDYSVFTFHGTPTVADLQTAVTAWGEATNPSVSTVLTYSLLGKERTTTQSVAWSTASGMDSSPDISIAPATIAHGEKYRATVDFSVSIDVEFAAASGTSRYTSNFTLNIYDNLTVTTNKDGSVTSVTTKINRDGKAVVVEVAEIEGYTVKVEGAAQNVAGEWIVAENGLNGDANVTIVYEPIAAEKHNVNLLVNGDEYGDAELSLSGELAEGTLVTVGTTPLENADNAKYDVKIEVEGATLNTADNTFVVGTEDVTVTVTFSAKKLVAKSETVEVKFNPAKTVEAQLEELEEELLKVVDQDATVIPEGEKLELTYQYYPWSEIDTIATDPYTTNTGDYVNPVELTAEASSWDIKIASGTTYTFGGYWIEMNADAGTTTLTGDCTERILLTWGEGDEAVTAVANVKLVEAREKATINYTKPTAFEFESEDEIIAKVKAAASTNSSNAITVTRVTETLPTGGSSATLTYKLSVAEDENYLANEITVEIDVIAKANPAQVNITVEGNGTVTLGTLSESGTLTAGAYDLTAKPSDNYYVASVEIDNVAQDVANLINYDAETRAWKKANVTISNDTTYNIKVSFAEAVIEHKDNMTIAVNGYVTADKTEDLKNKVLTAVLGEGYDAGKYTVEFKVNVPVWGEQYVDVTDTTYALAVNAALNDAQETFRITKAADGKIPKVVKEFTVNVTDSRPEADVSHNATVYTYDSAEDTVDIVSNLTVTPADRGKVSAVLADGQTLPAEGELNKTVVYKVTVEESVNNLKTETTVEVKVSNPQHLTKLTITPVANATIKVTDANGKEYTTGTQLGNGDYTVTVTPAKDAVVDADAYYVDTVTIDGTGVSAKQDGKFASTVYTQTVTIKNAEAEDTDVTISATTDKREIKKNAEIKNVTWSAGIDQTKFETNVFNAIVNTENGITFDDVTVTYGEITGYGKHSFTITWNASKDGKLPAVSVTADVELVSDVVINKDTEQVPFDGSNGDITMEAVIQGIKHAETAGEDAKYEFVSVLDENKTVLEGKGLADIDDLLTQGGTLYVSVKITHGDKTETVEVPITGAVKAADVKVVSNIENAISHVEVKDDYANGLHKYTFTLKEVDGYVLDTLKFVWEHATGRVFTETTPVTLALEDETDGGEITFTGKDFVDGKLIVYVADGTGEALSTVPAYTATATFVQPGITIPTTGTMNYYVGMLSTPEALNAKVLEALENAGGITYAPADLEETGTTEILYKAREQGTYTYSVTIDLSVLGIKTFDLPVTMPEMWKPIGSSFDAEVKEPTNEEIQEFVSELLKKYSFSELMAMANNTDKLKQILAEELENAEEFAAFYTNYGAHKFGEQETETVKLTVGAEDTKYGEVESNTSELTLTDTRIATSIALAEGVEMTYGFTEAELMAALGGAVTGENGTALGTAKLVTDVKGMGASTEPQTIKLEYAGNDQYKNCSAEATIIVNKAPVDVQVDNRRMKWQEGLTYDLPVVTDPAGVDVITFIVGLDVADMNIDNNSLVGLNGEIILLIPDELQGLLNPIFGADGADTTLAELKDALLAIAEVQGWTGSADETVQTLLSMLESLDTNVLNMTVRLGGGLPTDVGAYIVGAVSADANYTTDFGAGAIVIYPNGMKAELDWKYGDDNGIVHKDVLANVPDYLDAQVVKVHEGSIEEAQKEVVELFFGVTVNAAGEPEIVVTADPTTLAIGAYTEIGMISNFGNEMYYAVPIMRGVVVVPETVKVEIIDENGQVNRDRRFTYDRNQHGVDVRVTSTMGNVSIDTSKGDKSDNLTVTYIGVQTNAEVYNSTTPPTRTGVYSVVATYMETNGDEITLFGADAGVLAIEPAESYVEVDNKLYKYDGKGVTTADMVKAYSTVVGEPAPTTTVITAALATDGTFSENAFAAIDGIVNVDFPAWLDNYLKQIPALAGAYTEAGLDITKFYEYADELEALLAEVNIETDIVTKIVETLEQMPNDVKLTFKEQADVAPSAVGTYLVAGIVTDPDHYPSLGAALLVIYPELIKADLQWRAEDVNDNHVFKLDTVVNKVIDLGADAYLGGAYDQELSNITKTLYLGVDADNWQVNLVVDDQTKLTNGVYTEIAFMVKLDSVAYYAVPIQRTFVIAPESVTVQFVDKLDENNERHFVYDGTAKKMDVLVKEGSTTLADTRVAANENLTITYVGVQTNGKVYNSTEAPVHAGTYEVVATYAERENGKLVNFGAAVGIMVIEPTTASIEVESKAVPAGTTVKLSELITVKSPVAGETPDTTIITAQIATDGDFSDKGVLALDGNVNVDFPKWLDDILVKIDALDPAYNGTGLGTASFLENLQKIKTVLTDLGVDTQILDKLVTLLEQMPGANLTFNDQESVTYTAVGSYLVIGVVTDSDYYPAMDAGILTIYPNVARGELQWIREDSNNIYYLETLKTIDLGAKALFGGVEDSNVDPSELYLGINTETWEITLTDDQTELKEGVYTEIAYLNDTDANAHYAAPIVRPVIITDSIYPVVFIDENGNVNHERLFTYDGTPKSIGVATVRGTNINENNVPAGDTLKVVYIGTDSVGNPYNSETAPTDAGVYTVIATYATTNEDGEPAGGVGIGAVVIKKADLALDMKDTTVTYDGKGHFVDVTSNNEKADYLTVIVDKQNNVANIILEDDLTIAGGAVKTLLEKALGRSLDNEFSVTEVQQALHKVIDSIQAIEIPAEVKSMVNQLPDEMQQALKDMTMPVKDKLAEALQKLEDAMPVSGTVIFNGDLPVDAGKYEFYGFAISENYEPEATQGILTIEPVEVKVVLNSCEKFYGEKDPELGYAVEYPEGTTVRTDITVTELKRAEGEDVGEYAITAKAAAKDDKNFKVEVVSGKLTIKPAEITITVESAEKTYADEDPAVKYTFTVNNGKVTEEEIELSITRKDGNNAGDYDYVVNYKESDNWVVTVEETGKLTIKPIKLTVNVGDQEMFVGDEIPDLTYTVDGVLEGETLALTIKVSTEADGKTAGEYKITATVEGSDPNYVVGTVNEGTLTVKAKEETPDESGNTTFPEGKIPDNLYIDGKPVEKDEDGNFIIDNEVYGEKILATSYDFKNEESNNPHKVYPEHMYVWELTWDNEKEKYDAAEISALYDLLMYEGASIRVNDSYDAIRFISSIDPTTRSTLEKQGNTLLKGTMLEGYYMVEAGTLFKFYAGEGDYTNWNTASNVSFVYGGTLNEPFRVFATANGRNWFTGPLTLANATAEKLYNDVLSRPYVTLANAQGEEITLYGGEIQRSVYYVAVMNHATWNAGTAYDNYVEKLIATVEDAGYTKINRP